MLFQLVAKFEYLYTVYIFFILALLSKKFIFNSLNFS